MKTGVDIPELSLRHMKAMLQVHRSRNLTKAAQQLNRSQTAITKAINELENDLGVALFDRTTTGMLPTVYGDALAKRVEEAEAEFHSAGEIYLTFKKDRSSYQSIPVFSMEISYKRLASFIALFDTRDVNAAAERLGITRAAIYNSVRQLEDLLDLPLFERDPGGYTSTSFGTVLARHFKLAFAQIRHALDDLASLDGYTGGRVRIGTLPYTRTILTPRAINHLLEHQPQLDVSTQEGTYEQLERALRCGELDCIVGAIRPVDEHSRLITETLFEDQLSVIVRKGHPLESRKTLRLEDLMGYSWVLPGRNTPSRALFDRVLQNQELTTPEHVVETSSLSTVRGLLLESDRLALLSEHQIYYDKRYGLLTALPLQLADTYRPIGVTLRAQTEPSPAARLFLQSLRHVAGNLG
ncbi:LysR family transcriptional regulator [Pseudomaricurvus alkylphenolicus]|uniref:LysR family transcriptional regulator n=1 Tax=Pseudomaricurvus alkylphenolicus TaxID=1306991 RepID=UPI001F0D537F|nr:LysR family transcriptional regulator [Pseudomaricurvus alkylphenolicus]